jgi:hypothetical protein
MTQMYALQVWPKNNVIFMIRMKLLQVQPHCIVQFSNQKT